LSTTGHDFLVIGENIHATRVLLQKSERIATNEQGEEGIVFVDEDGATRHLRIPEYEKLSQSYQEGRIKHVRLAVQIAMAGVEPDCSTALSYLSTLARRQVKAGAHFLDVNLDEISNKLDDQLEAMRWLVRMLAPLVDIPLSIDSSNLEIIGAGVAAATEAAGTRVGPPMLNSASLERIEALELAARLKGPVVVTAAGESGMPANTQERVVNASRMIEASLAAGIGLDRIFVDPLVFPIAVDGEYGRHCLDAIAELRRRNEQRQLRASQPTAPERRVPDLGDRVRGRQRHRRPDSRQPPGDSGRGPDLAPVPARPRRPHRCRRELPRVYEGLPGR
jgi:hypothetical protein